MLHVTNGDHAAAKIRQAGIPGTVISWNDVLHEGPVPAGLDEAALREVRARFFAEQGWATYDQVLADFEQRDQTLAAHDEIALWFEHDLYDQLQLVQVLDALAGRAVQVHLIQADDYLGPMLPARIAALYPERQPVTPEQFLLARRAWAAFRAPEPDGVAALPDTPVLPFLAPALRRHLEDLPSVRNGLSRTEQQALEVIAEGARDRVAAFQAWQQHEEPRWMGDTSFWGHLARLSALLAGDDGELRLSERGHEVLDGRADWVRLGGVDRWWGGVHLRGSNVPWRWDGMAGRVTPSPPA